MISLPSSDVFFQCSKTCGMGKRGQKRRRVHGTLIATTYQMMFFPDDADAIAVPPSFFSVPLTAVERVSEKRTKEEGTQTLIRIHCKDMRTLTFGFSSETQRNKALTVIKSVAFPDKIEFTFAFYNKQKTSERSLQQQHVYRAASEFERWGVLKSSDAPTWRLADVNGDYRLCLTYSKNPLVLPTAFNIQDLSRAADFRSKRRIPSMTWSLPGAQGQGPTLWRSSQPRTGFDLRTGGGRRSRENEDLLNCVRRANRATQSLLIADCRPRVAALANKGKGYGFEDAGNYLKTSLEFLGIDNIHAMRSSYQRLESVCAKSTSASESMMFLKHVEDTNWLYYVRLVLVGAARVARALVAERRSVLVHCSDGWDRTSQICALAQIMVDPYFRTLDGFMVLVQKDWLSYGHKFRTRVGQASDKHSDDQRAPIFVQFLDCVWQLTRMYPRHFEFGEDLLLALAHHLYSCRFGTFLYNNERERGQVETKKRTTACLWTFFAGVRRHFASPFYVEKDDGPLVPDAMALARSVTLWRRYFCRWSPLPSFATQTVVPRGRPERDGMYTGGRRVMIAMAKEWRRVSNS